MLSASQASPFFKDNALDFPKTRSRQTCGNFVVTSEFRISRSYWQPFPAGLSFRALQSTGFALLGNPSEIGSFVMTAEDRLAELGISLPSPAAPVANYLPFVVSGSFLFVSGQLAFGPDGKVDPAHTGKLGVAVSDTAGQAAARLCVINILAQAKAALSDLDRISRCVRLGGFINAAPGFSNLAGVMNGASDLMVDVLGNKGRHARSTVGAAELPLDCAVEIEALFEIAGA
jgi:enamine deaminase RidA (YjgF/YER057c/UK114 family)